MSDHRDPKVRNQRWFGEYVAPWIALPIFLFVLPILLLRGLIHLTVSCVLQGLVWFRHRTWVVLVYSDSPKWKDRIESQIIPALPAGSVILNRSVPWSKTSLAGRVYRHFAGQHEFCPIGIVFYRWRWVHCFRFFQPFQDATRGNLATLNSLQAAFAAAVQSGR